MKTYCYNVEELYKLHQKKLIDELHQAMQNEVKVHVDLSTQALREPHSNLDIADDYYDALILGEIIAPFCASIEWDEIKGGYGTTHIRFTLTPRDTDGLGRKLAWYAQTMRCFLEPDDTTWIPEYPNGEDFEELRGTFNENLDNNVKHFDDLAESYVRNLVAGLREMFMGQELQEQYAELRVAYKRWWDPKLEHNPPNVNLSLLKKGMTLQEVEALFGGRGDHEHHTKVEDEKIHVSDYLDGDAREKIGRLWYLNGRLILWQTGKLVQANIDTLSSEAPEFILRIREKQSSKTENEG
jgi:hypothetical protein